MTVLACSQCGGAPERRLGPESGRRMYACPGCRHHGDATLSEEGARGSWQLINDPDLPPHNCKDGRPPRFFMRAGAWGARCTGCGFESAGFGSIGGAIAGWVRSMR